MAPIQLLQEGPPSLPAVMSPGLRQGREGEGGGSHDTHSLGEVGDGHRHKDNAFI